VTVPNCGELFTRWLHLRCPVEADAWAIASYAGIETWKEDSASRPILLRKKIFIAGFSLE
jgi:hypothetical protein